MRNKDNVEQHFRKVEELDAEESAYRILTLGY
mgnify:CR=1 FL=1